MIAAPLKNAPALFLAEEDYAGTGSTCLAVIEAKNLIPLAKHFLTAGFYLEDVSGLVTSDGAVSVYHFDHFDAPCRTTVLIVAPHEHASFPSIARIYQGAEWHERETRDFFGFTYEDNPNFIPLLLPDDMADVHPLEKPEEARATLATLFSAPGRQRKIVHVAEGFTLLDIPAKEEPVTEAPTPDAAPAPKVEVKAEAGIQEKPHIESETKLEPAPEQKPEPIAESIPTPIIGAPKTDKPQSATKPAPKPNGKSEPPASAKKPVKPSGKKGS